MIAFRCGTNISRSFGESVLRRTNGPGGGRESAGGRERTLSSPQGNVDPSRPAATFFRAAQVAGSIFANLNGEQRSINASWRINAM